MCHMFINSTLNDDCKCIRETCVFFARFIMMYDLFTLHGANEFEKKRGETSTHLPHSSFSSVGLWAMHFIGFQHCDRP